MNKLFFLIFIFVSIFSNTKSQEILSNTLVLVDFLIHILGLMKKIDK